MELPSPLRGLSRAQTGADITRLICIRTYVNTEKFRIPIYRYGSKMRRYG